MKKVLVFCAGGQGAQEALQLEEAIAQHNQGNDVTFLFCDESIGGCNDNRNFNKNRCKVCKYFQKSHRNKYLPKEIKQISIKSLITEDIKKKADIKFHYNDVNALRQITFHGIEIGLGALSSYISFTRNLKPLIDKDTREYFDHVLKSQVILTLVIEQLNMGERFDLFILFNGRYSIVKPFLNFAQNNKIDYICTETYFDVEGYINKDYYYNNIPHNIEPRIEKYFYAWNEAKERNLDRELIGKSFFERRRNAESTGDKVYTKNQTKDAFVNDWDESKENIVIFNSSEDEFCAISSDYDKRKVFPNQIEGIKTILEHYKEDTTKHFYLRVHPNLINVKYSYHLDLYRLHYPNLTVIPANSPISSYSLLDKADKVITFGSTMGIEATYARKPSISIGPTFYELLDVVYHPKSLDQIWEYIDNATLKDKYNINVLVFGYYYMATYKSLITNHLKYIEGRKVSFQLLGKKRVFYAYEKLFGSNYLYFLASFFIHRYLGGEPPSKEDINH